MLHPEHLTLPSALSLHVVGNATLFNACNVISYSNINVPSSVRSGKPGSGMIALFSSEEEMKVKQHRTGGSQALCRGVPAGDLHKEVRDEVACRVGATWVGCKDRELWGTSASLMDCLSSRASYHALLAGWVYISKRYREIWNRNGAEGLVCSAVSIRANPKRHVASFEVEQAG